MHHPYYTIPVDEPFLPALAKGMLARFGDPLTLAQCTVFLPTRRSCRAFADILYKESGKPSLMLPRIQAVGDVEEDVLQLTLPMEAELLPPIAKPRRILLLAGEIRAWLAKERDRALTFSESCQWAAALCTLLDETHRHHAPLEKLHHLLPAELPQHRQDLLDFLSVIDHKWPRILKRENALDPEQHREQRMQMERALWQHRPPQHPVIIAGSTGSIPSTAVLMQAIATLPQGYVILPGLDIEICGTLPKHHPQYPMQQLATTLGEFKLWNNSAPQEMQHFARALFAPEITLARTAAIPKLSLLEAENETHEAAIIALLMRETLETPEETAMLVTPDRALASRVSALLMRWNIAANDSTGQPLMQTPAGSLFLHSLRSALAAHAAEPLLIMLKHPLASLGLSREECRTQTRAYEIAVLRNRRRNTGADFAARIAETLAPLNDALAKPALTLEAILSAHWQSFLALMATDTKTGDAILAARPEGAALANTYASLLASSGAVTLDTPHEYEAVLTQLLQLFSYRPAFGTHPRLSILSPMEARLMDADRIIVSSLNDGEWPRQDKADWLGERLRTSLGLPGKDEAESHAAHDFIRLFGARELFLTRARYQEGAPRNPHAWVLRLALLLNRTTEQTTYNQTHWQKWARQVATPHNHAAPLALPKPCPPSEARPTRFSASDIAILMQQPYRYYAERILRLKPMEPLELELEAHLIGSAIHRALENYTHLYPVKNPQASLQQWLEEEMRYLLPANHPLWRIWRPRLAEVARNFLAYDESERQHFPLVLAELRGEAMIGMFTLHAKADRLAIAENGTARISDYKTGTVPENRDIKSGLKPQLLIESLLFQEGGFPMPEEAPKITAQEAPVHWKLSATSGRSEYLPIPETAPAHTRQQLLRLLQKFHDAKQPYICIPLNSLPNYDAYLHLARVSEIYAAA